MYIFNGAPFAFSKYQDAFYFIKIYHLRSFLAHEPKMKCHKGAEGNLGYCFPFSNTTFYINGLDKVIYQGFYRLSTTGAEISVLTIEDF